MTTEVTILLQLFLTFWLSISNSLQFSDRRFTVDRGYRDSFPNPDCDSTTCPNICHRYDANCDAANEDTTYPCHNCYCREEKRNFVGNGKDGGRCVNDLDLVKDSMPKGEVSITSRRNCMFVDPNIVLKYNCDYLKGYMWIYTPDHRFMNLNRLNCLAVGPENKAMVFPCKISGKKQQWDLDTKGFLFNNETGAPMYINKDLTVTNSKDSDHFRFKKERPRQVEYKGCYRFNDGSFMRYLKFNPSQCKSAKDCFTTTKILAPIYEENSKCFINWKTSSYLVDNKPWQYVPKPDDDLTISSAENSRGIYVKIPYTSYGNWSGKVLKIEVKCSSKTTSEEHCALIKFPSSFERYIPTSNPSFNPWPDSNDTKKSKHSNPYKISTIVLSVLIFIILVSIVVYFAIQSHMCKKLTRRHHSPSVEIPFCAETDEEPEM